MSLSDFTHVILPRGNRRGPRSIKLHYQLDSRGCGAACLAMICDHYRLKYSRQHLQVLCARDRQGVSLATLKAAAEQLGFQCRMVKAKAEEVVEHAWLPAIAFWPRKHFVVVYNVRRRSVAVADPAFGRIVYTIDDFRSRWEFQPGPEGAQGVLLLLTPVGRSVVPEHPEQTESARALIAPYLNEYRLVKWKLAACGVSGLAAYLMLPWIARAVVDFGISQNNSELIRLLLIGQFVTISAQATAHSTQNWLIARTGNRINNLLTASFLSKLARVPLSFFDQHVQRDLVQRVSDHYRIQDFLATGIAQAALMLLLLVVFGFALYANHPRFLLMYTLGGAAYLLTMIVLMRRRSRLDYERFETSSRSHGVLLEYLTGIQDLRLYGAEEAAHRKWAAVQDRLAALNNRLAVWDQGGQVAGTLISASTTLLITFFASNDVLAGTLSFGGFVAVQFIIGQLNAPLAQSMDVLRRWQDARLTLERISSIHLHRDEWSGDDAVRSEGADVRLVDVSFSYGGTSTRRVLTDVSFDLPEGRTTAIVGPSGSGKTTLLKLLLGFYPLDNGEIMIGGVSLHSLAPVSWRRRCGVVMQDGFLFSDTIARNIALGCNTWDEARMAEVVQIAQLESFLLSLPRGIETEVGLDGVGLSRGQVLRILIARALYSDPEYLFFDEATSALDGETEAAVVAGIKAATENKTVLIVAHRLSTVRNADQIIVLDAGTVVEKGSHSDLVAQRGKYYRLISDQLELDE